MTQKLKDLLTKAENWSPAKQEELIELGRFVEEELNDAGEYVPTPEERKAIKESLADADAGRFASEEEVAATFAKFRRA